MERSLLAGTQQRLGPNHQSLFGFLVFVFDGIKLFSKSIAPANFYSLLTAGFLLLIPFILDAQISRSFLASGFNLQFSLILLAGILETFSFSTFVSVQNSYVTLGITRLLEITVCLELTFGLLETLGFGLAGFCKVGTSNHVTSWFFAVLVFGFLVCDFGKVPFDVIEAESELIDGWTTEFGGYAFSAVYAAEVVTGFLALKLISTQVGFSLLTISVLVLAVFWGRILLARFTIFDAAQFLLSVGLLATLLAFTTF